MTATTKDLIRQVHSEWTVTGARYCEVATDRYRENASGIYRLWAELCARDFDDQDQRALVAMINQFCAVSPSEAAPAKPRQSAVVLDRDDADAMAA